MQLDPTIIKFLTANGEPVDLIAHRWHCAQTALVTAPNLVRSNFHYWCFTNIKIIHYGVSRQLYPVGFSGDRIYIANPRNNNNSIPIQQSECDRIVTPDPAKIITKLESYYQCPQTNLPSCLPQSIAVPSPSKQWEPCLPKQV